MIISKISFIVEDAKIVAELITSFTIFEQIYLQREPPTTVSLRQVLARLYEARLIYLSKAKKYFKQSVTIIIIDAVDECDFEQGASLLEALESILKDAFGMIKILVSSR